MRSWALATEGYLGSQIKMVADGNGDYSKALGLTADFSQYKMGTRSKRFAFVAEYGKVTLLNIDEEGLVSTSAEALLEALSK